MNKAPVSTSPPLLTKWTSDKLLAKEGRTVVLNLWVTTLEGQTMLSQGLPTIVGKHT